MSDILILLGFWAVGAVTGLWFGWHIWYVPRMGEKK